MTTATFTSDLVGIGVPWPLATYFATGRVEFNGINALTAGISPFPIAGQAATTATGTGGNITVTGGAGGSTSGAGGNLVLAGGSVTSGNVGTVIVRSNMLTQASVATALTASATLTAAQVITKYLKSTPGGAANANYQLPTGTALEAVFSGIATNDSFEFVITNVSAVAAETCTVTTNTGWTLEGNMVVQSNNASTNWSVGRFLAVRTGANTFTLRRV